MSDLNLSLFESFSSYSPIAFLYWTWNACIVFLSLFCFQIRWLVITAHKFRNFWRFTSCMFYKNIVLICFLDVEYSLSKITPIVLSYVCRFFFVQWFVRPLSVNRPPQLCVAFHVCNWLYVITQYFIWKFYIIFFDELFFCIPYTVLYSNVDYK